jgi:hypothetical protein
MAFTRRNSSQLKGEVIGDLNFFADEKKRVEKRWGGKCHFVGKFARQTGVDYAKFKVRVYDEAPEFDKMDVNHLFSPRAAPRPV